VKPKIGFFTKKTVFLISLFFLFGPTKIVPQAIFKSGDCPGNTSTKIFVNSGCCTRILPVSKRIGRTLDEIRWSVGELILSTTNKTIENPGLYVLGEDVECPIIVDSSDVVIDLNGYSIFGTCTAITIKEDKKNIVIKNGSLNGSSDCSFVCAEENLNSADGIVIEAGVELVQIEDLNIFGYERGIFFQGTSESPTKSHDVKNTILHCNRKGAVLHYTIKSTFENVEALNCIEAGFELYKSEYNYFEKCKALEIENGDIDKSAIGFSTTSGKCNIFIECIANGIKKTNSSFCHSAKGFLLQGTSTEIGETGTEIFNSIVNKVEVTAGDGNAYGIHQNMQTP